MLALATPEMPAADLHLFVEMRCRSGNSPRSRVLLAAGIAGSRVYSWRLPD